LTLQPKDKIPYADLTALLAKDAIDLSKPSAELVWPSHGPASGVKPKGKRGRKSSVSPPHAGAGAPVVIDLDGGDSGVEGAGKARRGGKAPRRSEPSTPHTHDEDIITLTGSDDVAATTAAAAVVKGNTAAVAEACVQGKGTPVGSKRGRGGKATRTKVATTSDTEGSAAEGKGAKPRRKRGSKPIVDSDTEVEEEAPRGKRARTSINNNGGGAAGVNNAAAPQSTSHEEEGGESDGPVTLQRKRQPTTTKAKKQGTAGGKAAATTTTPKGKAKVAESEGDVITINSGTESDAPKAKRARVSTETEQASVPVNRSKQLPIKRARTAASRVIASDTESDSDVQSAPAPATKRPRNSKPSPTPAVPKAPPTRARRSLSSEPETGFTTEVESETSAKKAPKGRSSLLTPGTPSTAAATPASGRVAKTSSLAAVRVVAEAITPVVGNKRGRQEKVARPAGSEEETSVTVQAAAPAAVPAKRAEKKQAPAEKKEPKKQVEAGTVPSRPAPAPRTLSKPTPMSRMPATPSSHLQGAGAAPRMTFSATRRPASPARTLGQLADGKDVHPDKDKHRAVSAIMDENVFNLRIGANCV
jgi:hypothetical protein